MSAPDPERPTVTFDSYVIPETVRSAHRDAPQAAEPKTQANPVALDLEAARKAAAQGAALLQGASPRTLALGGGGALCLLAALVLVMALPSERTDAPPAGVEAAVTRLQGPELLSATRPAASGVREGRIDAQELTQRAREAATLVARPKLAMLREEVLSAGHSDLALTLASTDPYAVLTRNADNTRRSMGDMLLQASEVAARLAEADAAGEIALPGAYRTAMGALDTDVMIFSLVQTALADDGTEAGAAAARSMSHRAFASSTATTQEAGGQMIYTVGPEDSLAHIALQFYGRPNALAEILQSNSAQLSASQQVRVGQRLIIPRQR